VHWDLDTNAKDRFLWTVFLIFLGLRLSGLFSYGVHAKSAAYSCCLMHMKHSKLLDCNIAHIFKQVLNARLFIFSYIKLVAAQYSLHLAKL
jgi:uncharacterized membrane-anchored protein YitT (DUF2179 family)